MEPKLPPKAEDSPFKDLKLERQCVSLDPINGQPKDRDEERRQMHGYFQCLSGEGQRGPVVRGSTRLQPNSDSQVMTGYQNVGGGQDQFPITRPVKPGELQSIEPVQPKVEAEMLKMNADNQKETDRRRGAYCRVMQKDVERLNKMGTRHAKNLATEKATQVAPYCDSVTADYFSLVQKRDEGKK